MKILLLSILISISLIGASYAESYTAGYSAYSQGDYETAIQKWTKASEDGIGGIPSENALGDMYYFGNGVTQDYKEAAKWYKKAAYDHNHIPGSVNTAYGQYSLGFMYYYGQGVLKDYKEAIKLYKMAAEEGYSDSQYSLGWMYIHGEGVPENYKDGIKWYTKAAEQGNVNAQNSLGRIYYWGEGVLKDPKEGFKWHKKAAEQGGANNIHSQRLTVTKPTQNWSTG